MADQRVITLYAGDATPKDIVLRALPARDVAANVVCWLYPISAPAVASTPNPREITLRAGDVTPTDIVLYPRPTYPTAPEVVITLRGFGAPVAAPAVIYYGILKRWTGGAWAPAPLKTYVGGAWQAKPLSWWNGSDWKIVNTTGV